MLWLTPNDCQMASSGCPPSAHQEDTQALFVKEIIFRPPEDKCHLCCGEATQVCHYSGEFFCTPCFDGAEEHFIPGRILNSGNFQKGMVSPQHLRTLRTLWATYPIRLPSRLMKASRSFSRYTSVKRKYLVLRQILRLRPRSSGSEASSAVSSCSSSIETDPVYEEQFSCHHGDQFKNFENLSWMRPHEDYFTMQEIVVATLSPHLADTLESACLAVHSDLASCCLRTRKASIGDRCEDEVKCFACQSEYHVCSRRLRKTRSGLNGQRLSLSLLSERRFSLPPTPLAIPLGGIACRRVANDHLRHQDIANSWLRQVKSAAEASRERFANLRLQTLAQFIEERKEREKKVVVSEGIARSV